MALRSPPPLIEADLVDEIHAYLNPVAVALARRSFPDSRGGSI